MPSMEAEVDFACLAPDYLTPHHVDVLYLYVFRMRSGIQGQERHSVRSEGFMLSGAEDNLPETV